MSPHYRHTQVGWVTIGSILGGGLLLLVLLAGIRELPGAWIAVLPLLLAGLLFATLTVEVKASELRVRYTAGVIRRRLALADVRGVRAVRNPWYYGWGIHKLRGGWIWNVSGFEAVELALVDGSVWRVGTDEPEALARAVAAAAPHARAARQDDPLHEGRRGADAPFAGGGPWRAVAVAAVVLVGTALFVLPFYLQTRDPKVTITQRQLRIENLFYGQDYPLADVTAVSLEPRLPRVLARTNGFAGGGLLRGWFAVEGLGKGKLFVDAGSGPFVLVRLRSGFVIFNVRDSEATRALYEQLTAALPPS
jgi:hypothetical protein